MSLEKEWWKGVYADDIHNYLRLKEKRRFMYKHKSPELSLRRKTMEWLIRVCDKLEFCTPVRHLAVYYLDIFMDNHKIEREHLDMLALGCLMIAVKVEELDKLIPKNSDLNALVGNRYKLAEFVQIEVELMKFFKYSLLTPTASHFADYYSLYALTETDTLDGKPLPNFPIFRVYVYKYIEYFLEISLLDNTYRNYAPSLVAASCIAATRLCLILTPPWPVQLQNITFYKYAQLKPCVDLLIKALENDMFMSRKKSLQRSEPVIKNGDISPSSSSISTETFPENIEMT